MGEQELWLVSTIQNFGIRTSEAFDHLRERLASLVKIVSFGFEFESHKLFQFRIVSWSLEQFETLS